MVVTWWIVAFFLHSENVHILQVFCMHANHQITHRATSQMGCQLGDCRRPFKSSFKDLCGYKWFTKILLESLQTIGTWRNRKLYFLPRGYFMKITLSSFFSFSSFSCIIDEFYTILLIQLVSQMQHNSSRNLTS